MPPPAMSAHLPAMSACLDSNQLSCLHAQHGARRLYPCPLPVVELRLEGRGSYLLRFMVDAEHEIYPHHD